ncbi:hypothetical protein ABZ568_00525 [Streptomyces olindensis]|uniref:Uncharacterized protein n=1 Tax=Streptomyces olindensis TaxID=358823 RepID=A0ABV2XLR5_9ACTN
MGRSRGRRVRNRWYKHAKGWTAVATATGVIIGILTLAFTGVTTIFQAWVSSDQLQQSKEDARRAERAQASRITFWTDEDAEGVQRLHLKNGSVDPVSSVTLVFRVLETPGPAGISLPLGRYVGTFPGLAPCSELVIDKGKLTGKAPPDSELVAVGVEFTDTNGTEWLRTPTALGPPPTDHLWWAETFPGEREGELMWPPAVKPATSCS